MCIHCEILEWKQTLENTDNIGYARRRQTKQKHNTICVGDHYAQASTNNADEAIIIH